MHMHTHIYVKYQSQLELPFFCDLEMFVLVTINPPHPVSLIHHFIYSIKRVQKCPVNAYLANVLHIITGMQMSY